MGHGYDFVDVPLTGQYFYNLCKCSCDGVQSLRVETTDSRRLYTNPKSSDSRTRTADMSHYQISSLVLLRKDD